MQNFKIEFEINFEIGFSKQNWKQNFQQDFKIGNPNGFEMEFEFKGIQMDLSEEIQMALKIKFEYQNSNGIGEKGNSKWNFK